MARMISRKPGSLRRTAVKAKRKTAHEVLMRTLAGCDKPAEALEIYYWSIVASGPSLCPSPVFTLGKSEIGVILQIDD
jgi:hypothetical protein